MTPELRDRWERALKETEQDLPELRELGRRMMEASFENTLTGHLRAAVHSSQRDLRDIASDIGISPGELTEFLSGDRNLRSDVLDRLASAVDFARQLSQSSTGNKQ